MHRTADRLARRPHAALAMRFKDSLRGAIVGADAPSGRPILEAAVDELLQDGSLRIGMDVRVQPRRCIDRVLQAGRLPHRSTQLKRATTTKRSFVEIPRFVEQPIVVRYEAGRSSRLTMRPPMASPTDVSAAGDPEAGRDGGRVVAIVDDEPLLVELAEELVVKLGFVALAFNSGGDALAAFDDPALKVDLLLTDEVMPVLSGSELVAAIREKGWNIPVIVMSGNVTAALEQRARANGVCALLRKPLSHATLAAALARCLRPLGK